MGRRVKLDDFRDTDILSAVRKRRQDQGKPHAEKKRKTAKNCRVRQEEKSTHRQASRDRRGTTSQRSGYDWRKRKGKKAKTNPQKARDRERTITPEEINIGFASNEEEKKGRSLENNTTIEEIRHQKHFTGIKQEKRGEAAYGGYGGHKETRMAGRMELGNFRESLQRSRRTNL